jgi:hypothetical protein
MSKTRQANPSIQLTDQDVDYIGRVVRAEVGTLEEARQRGLTDAQHSKMVDGVIESILNRTASEDYPGSVQSVISQKKQYTPLNVVKGDASKIAKAPSNLQRAVELKIADLAKGSTKTTGNRLSYANISISDLPNQRGWIADALDKMTMGIPGFSHTHMNPDWAKPPAVTNLAPGQFLNPSKMDRLNIGYNVSPRTLPSLPGRLSEEARGVKTGVPQPRNVPVPQRAPRDLPPALPAVNPSAIQRMQDNLTSKMAFARPNPSNMNISGYGFSTPANPSARGSATGSINRASAVGNLAVPGRSPGVLGGRGNINPPSVVAAPANVLSNFDQFGNFTGNRQSSKAPTSDFRSTLTERAAVPQSVAQRTPTVSTWGGMANAPVVQAPTRQSNAPGPTNDPSVRTAQADLAKSNRRDQFARDLIKSMPAPVQTDAAKLASQYSQYQRGTVPSAQINPSVYDMVDVPQSNTIAAQYASYGAGKIAPQVATTATRSSPAAPQTRAPSVNVPGPVGAPQQMTQQQRMDKALADMRVGIPPQDIYDENAPGRSGFRGFGAGGFLGNLLTGNIGNMRGIEGGNRLPGILGVIQGVVQNLGGPQQAQQAVQTVAPALGQVMGLPAAQQAARAGNNMVIGRDANGNIGWVADGGLSSGAFGAGWASNNPERNYGGYGSGFDPSPS